MAYTYKVEIEGNQGFILDTDLLDTGLLGYLRTDITQYVRSVSAKRGKSSALDKFTAGQMTIVFDNRARVFDPQNTSSPIYGSVVPRKTIRFSAGYDSNSLHTQFVGFIDDWNFSYDVSGDSTAEAHCSDAFTVFATQNVTLTTPTAEISDARALRVLTNSQVAWPTDQFFAEGAVMILDSVTYSGNALDYLQSIADSEQGLLYVNRSGNVTLLGWNYFTQDIIGGIAVDLQFSDQSWIPGYPFSSLEVNYGTEQLYNYVTVTSSAGTVVAQSTSSQQTYRVATFDTTTLQNGTAQMQTLANSLVNTYSQPVFRINHIEVPIEGLMQFYSPSTSLGSAAVSTMFQADVGYSTNVNWTPNGVGSYSSQYGIVIGKTVTASPAGCNVSFEIGSYVQRSPL
jgi:hypothetical protein